MPLTSEQQALRARGIGASEIGAVAGLSPWASPHDIWERKVGLAKKFEPTAYTEWGTHVETGIISLWRERETYKGRTPRVRYIGRHQKTIIHPDHPICVATPDGLVDTDSVLEVKTYGYYTAHHWGEPGTDEVPEYHAAQVTWAMAAALRSRAIVLGAYEREVNEYRVSYSQDFFDALLEVGQRFWADYVLPKKAPPPDHTDRCREFLARYYPRADANKTMLQSTDEVEDAARMLRDADTMAAEAKRRKTLAGNILMDYIGEAYGVSTAQGKVLWYGCKGRQTYDGKALAHLAHELGATDEQLAQYIRQSPPYRVLRGYWPKGD